VSLLEHIDVKLLTPLANLFIKTIDASSISQSADLGSSSFVCIDFVHHVVYKKRELVNKRHFHSMYF